MNNKEIFKAFPEIKSLAVQLAKDGVPTQKISEELGVPASFIYRWRKDDKFRKLLMQNSEHLRARNDMIRRLNFLRHMEIVEKNEPQDPYGSRDPVLAATQDSAVGL